MGPICELPLENEVFGVRAAGNNQPESGVHRHWRNPRLCEGRGIQLQGVASLTKGTHEDKKLRAYLTQRHLSTLSLSLSFSLPAANSTISLKVFYFLLSTLNQVYPGNCRLIRLLFQRSGARLVCTAANARHVCAQNCRLFAACWGIDSTVVCNRRCRW